MPAYVGMPIGIIIFKNPPQDELVREEISRCEQNAKDGKFRLGDLLAVPMQRILKYHLLLRELLQHTSQVSVELCYASVYTCVCVLVYAICVYTPVPNIAVLY